MVLSRTWQQGTLLYRSLGPVAKKSTTSTLARSLHSSRPVRASPSSGSTSQHDEDEHYPSEGFNTPIWRNTILLMIAAVGVYRVSTLHGDLPSTSRSIDPDADTTDAHDDEEASKGDNDNRPFLTRYIDYYSTPSSVWKERNERHLDAVREKAEEKLLFQDAERPPVHRFRYANTFEQASPHRMPVGSQVDLSDLKVKQSSE